MSSENTDTLFLLTLTGQVSLHFMDDRILQGKIAAQDSLNIFLTIDDEPLMIPRSQIRYIRGRAGQTIEADTVSHQGGASQVKTLESGRVRLKTSPSIWDTDVSNLETDPTGYEAKDTTGVAFFDDDEESTMLLEATEDSDATLFIDEAPDDEATLLLDEAAEEGTLVVEKAPAAPLHPAFLECTSGPHSGQRFELGPGLTTIGRSSDNMIVLSGDKEVSRRHAQIISEDDDTFVIEDRGSLNGVIINGTRIENPTPLHENDNLLIGISTLIFQPG
jgi:translation elongation factor P/translation initiation factor 5A